MIYKVNNVQVYQFGGSIKSTISNLADKFKSALIAFKDKINTLNRTEESPMKKVIGTEDVYIPRRPKNIATFYSAYGIEPHKVKRGGEIA